ncbi:helix-turn-helix transcriptional regulator [Methylobacterium radiotolerans]|uniref:helix-turn-helix transcriptional regulator n=1 Tax=Methylobacterium radiotolerans TaxID=31998 RepID=UPI001F3DD3AD|nr:helix-turn-helix domain-containing protein [Methylobacterium radiotolerans]UIY40824.1 helix-turn-helix domain-containing protein [Methylobacterium radiotolerans]
MSSFAPTNPRAVIRLPDVAAELGIHPDTLRKMCHAGDGPRLLRLSTRCYGVRRADLETWLESREMLSMKAEGTRF